MTPMSSAASPILATRASMWVPLKLISRASTKSATAVSNSSSLDRSKPNNAATKPPPNSATAVTVTITAHR